MPWTCKPSDEEILAAVRRMGAERNGTLKLYDFCDAVGISPATINRRFGGWLKLREQAGLTAARSFAAMPLLERQQRLVKQFFEADHAIGPGLTLTQFCEHARVSPQTVQRLFTSWRGMLRVLGVGPGMAAENTTMLSLLRELRSVHEQLGQYPTTEQLIAKSRYPLRLYCRHFHTRRGLQERYAWFRKDPSLRPEPEVAPFRFGPNGFTGLESLEALGKAAGPFVAQAAGG